MQVLKLSLSFLRCLRGDGVTGGHRLPFVCGSFSWHGSADSNKSHPEVEADNSTSRYTGFVRLKASSYFLAGGESDDLIQEGMIGLYKAVRDFRADKETSFRSFAELCVTRQIITAIKTATRFKHAPLNTYVSFSHTPAGQESEGECTLGDALPGPSVNDPSVRVISTEELQSLVGCLGSSLSNLESEALRLYLEGFSYEGMAEELGCDTKTIDNALQRVKRKILAHQKTRQVLN